MKSWLTLTAALVVCLGILPTVKAEEPEDGNKGKYIRIERISEAEAAEGDTAESGKEGKKELKFAGTPYVYTGPDTGFGVGFAIMYRDIFGKEGRDTSFSFSYTESQYQVYSIDWQEPYFLSPNGRLKLYLGYEEKPAMRYYGIGNFSTEDDLCNYSWTKMEFQPRYTYRIPETQLGAVGLRLQATYMHVDPRDGEIADELDDVFWERLVSDLYPEDYYSYHFMEADLIGVGVGVYLDRRVDRFPLGGGREEVVWPIKGNYFEADYDRFDEILGSDLSYNRVELQARQFIPLFSDDTILALQGKAIMTQGEVPFHQMPSFGDINNLRGYYGNRFIDKNSTQFNVEIRQAFFTDWRVALFDGLIKAQYPSFVLFYEEGRVYEDYTDIPEEMFEDYHYAVGGGFRFIITPSVVIRFELGWSDENQAELYVNAGLPF